MVISPATAQRIVRHWVGLGDQHPPYEDDSVLFRYHDARVMQRVWPALSASQQSLWLGPVTQWWSLAQAWGPFNAMETPPCWFRAEAPTSAHETEFSGSLSRLFDDTQWFLGGASPDANLIWRGYAENDIAPDAQPDADDMLRMLADGARLGLHGPDLEDYVWTTWQHAPKDGPPHALDWSLPHLAPLLHRIQAQRREQPDARFSTLLNKIIQSQR